MELKTSKIKALEPIKFNYEELKQELQAKLNGYKNLVYTSENIKSAKTDRATLNKLAKAINDERIRVKNEVLAPFADFDIKCTELIEMIKTTNTNIDTQIKNYEQDIKDKKLNEITTFFMENSGIYKELIDFDKIYNERWLNLTYKMSDIEAEIQHIFAKTDMDFKTIENHFKDDENIQKQAKQFYLNNITNSNVLSLAIFEGDKIIDQNKKLEELKQKETESTQNITDTTRKITGSTQKETETTQNETQSCRLAVIDFRVECTKIQMEMLKDFLKANNIKYGPVPKN